MDSHRNLARALGRPGFAARYPYGFLVHRPVLGDVVDPDDDGDDADDEEELSFITGVVSRDNVEIDLLDDGKLLSVRDWIIEPVAKRRGNPYPDRISVGRAKNCDVVLRYPSISKLHAHFRLADSQLDQLTDYQSANGTYVNNHRLGAGQALAVQFGDRLRFGVLELQLVSAAALYNELVRTTLVGKDEE